MECAAAATDGMAPAAKIKVGGEHQLLTHEHRMPQRSFIPVMTCHMYMYVRTEQTDERIDMSSLHKPIQHALTL